MEINQYHLKFPDKEELKPVKSSGGRLRPGESNGLVATY
jgi:hypothetical protein